MRVTDASGRTWVVRRQLIRRPRWRGFGRPRVDVGDGAVAGAGGGSLSDLAFGILVVATLVFSIAFVWPLIVLALELVFASLVLAARFVTGRWTVVAETRAERRTWPVRGRSRATSLAADVAEAIKTGRALPEGENRETTPSLQLTDAEIARREPSGHVRVIKR